MTVRSGDLVQPLPVDIERVKAPKFNRRDFLKIASVAAGVVAFGDLQRLPSQGELGKIETEDAIYYPLFGRHDRHVDLIGAFVQNPQQPLVHFGEIISPAYAFQAMDSLSTLTTTLAGPDGQDYGRMFTNEELLYFVKNNIKVAYEGTNLNGKYFQGSHTAESTEAAIVLGVDVGAAIQDTLARVKGESVLSHKNLLANMGALLGTIWLFSPQALGDVSLALGDLPENNDLRKVKLALNNLAGHINLTHPETMQVFFRNLVIARKLQTLAHVVPDVHAREKPAISFLLGMEHTAIQDLLVLGESVTMAGFSLYSKETLKEIVDSNGGIDAFCSTVILSPKSIFLDGTAGKQSYIDQALKEYLEVRLR